MTSQNYLVTWQPRVSWCYMCCCHILGWVGHRAWHSPLWYPPSGDFYPQHLSPHDHKSEQGSCILGEPSPMDWETTASHLATQPKPK